MGKTILATSVCLLLLTTLNPLAYTIQTASIEGVFPYIISSPSTVTISSPQMTSQVQLRAPDFLVFYPPDQGQEFRFLVSFEQLLEVPPQNQTQLTLDAIDLQSAPWTFAQQANASNIIFGHYVRMQLSTLARLNRGTASYPVTIIITLFASQIQNETAVVSNDWLAIESFGGPLELKLDVAIRGWPFRIVQDQLILRLLLDGSQGTVRHHGEFSGTDLFNTVTMINDVNQHQDAYIQWLRRAIIDNGTSRKSADVMLKTYAMGDALGVDLYYPSFANATLNHDPIIALSNTFIPAAFVPLQIGNILIGGIVLLLVALVIVFLSRRSQYALRRI